MFILMPTECKIKSKLPPKCSFDFVIKFSISSLLVTSQGIMGALIFSASLFISPIRIAIGATESDVLRQFLSESVVLSMAGGILGILFGVASSMTITKVLGWSILISPVAVGAAVVFSTAVGIFFGFYPARKAAMLDPIEALRFE